MLRKYLSRAAKLGADLAVVAGVFGLAYLVRFEGVVPEPMAQAGLLALPLVLLVNAVCLAALGVPRQTWKHVSLPEARALFLALGLASGLLTAGRLLSAGPSGPAALAALAHVPLGVLLIGFVLGLAGSLGVRVGFRLATDRPGRRPGDGGRRAPVPTLLIGAEHVGALVTREIHAARGSGIRPVGFLTMDPARVGTTIHGVSVVGTVEQLEEKVRKHRAGQVLITLDRMSGATVARISRRCKDCGVGVKIVPAAWEVLDGRVNLKMIRDVAIEDLLRRAPVELDRAAIAGILHSRRVLVTGAGGSIGSELCREVCQFRPAVLVLVEQAENSLFHVRRRLAEEYPQIPLVPCVADICDDRRMDAIFTRHRPELVFHAAAHKHVPLMEENPGEAVKNNVLGTRKLANLAHAHGVGGFVMISTDKAVRPSSVMGVSKRVAEIYVQGLSQRSDTRFVTVRFGNVLGSNGSVVPIFKDQIARGGPVTVTHPEMTRYFMTIPEACQLVLQAATMGRGGEIFILDMGKPVKIVDLARDLIRLSGLEPEDIEIVYTGVRPGEKLYEQLALEEESAAKTKHPRIYIGRLRASDWEEIDAHLDELRAVADCGEPSTILAKLKEIVPEFQYECAAGALTAPGKNGVA
jgi:FlaA1/EpsC-like NDP-sugar epimerase